MPVETVVFDLGGVFVPFDFGGAWDALREGTGWTRLDVEHRTEDLRAGHNLGRLDGEEFHRQMCDRLEIEMRFSYFCQAWCDIFTLDSETVSLAERLSANYGIYLLSNTGGLHWPFIEKKFDLKRLFEGVVLSYEVGALKPDAAIYNAGIEDFGWVAENTVFIDDLKDNVAGAKSVGMAGIIFKSAQQTRQELEELGVTLG